MFNKKIVVQISEGLGNQLFMFAHAYTLSKKLRYNLYIDNISGYQIKKNLLRNHQKYILHDFNIRYPLIKNDLLINYSYSRILKKIYFIFDRFKSKKNFFVEFKEKINGTKTIKKPVILDSSKIANKIYIMGNFEDQNYFKDYKSDLKKIFLPKKNNLDLNSKLIDQLQKNNSISIHIRRNRFSDQKNLTNNDYCIEKSDDFTNDSVTYINKSITYFKNKIENPKFFIWSNDFVNIEKFTKKLIISDFQYIKTNSIIKDFYLFSFSKHFIVSPSSFHWWGAWLNENPNKICLRPSTLNPSNNLNFWPEEWVPI
jgi:hypothetical protein